MIVGEDGEVVGSDFVGRITISSDAIGTSDDHADAIFAHDLGGHVVADDGDVDARGGQFVGGEARALQEWARFVSEDVEFEVVLVGDIHGRGGGADTAGGQCACVAMGEYADAGMIRWVRGCVRGCGELFDNFKAVVADGVAHVAVVVMDLHSMGQKVFRRARFDLFHLVDSPEQVDGSGAAGGEMVRVLLESREGLLGTNDTTIGRSNPDSGRAAHG